MTKLTGAALDRALANAMGLKSVHNCDKWGEHMIEEDEEFQRLEREAKMRRRAKEDDDIQVYKKPWVNLTKEERASFDAANPKTQEEWDALFDGIEAKLKEKNT